MTGRERAALIPGDSRRALVCLLLAAAAGAVPGALEAQLLSIDVSNDITWTAGASTIDDEGAKRVTLPSTVSALDLGALPAAADVAAFQVLEDGRRAFSLDIFVDLGGGLYVGPDDVAAWNGSTYSVFLDGSSIGIPAGSTIDAIALHRQSGVSYTLLSFDVPTALPGGITADDEDIVAWSGTAWTVFFDGSSNGVPNDLDVDGFDRDRVDGTRYFSFDTSGKITTVNFDDEDVVAFDGSTWSLAYDASANLGAAFAAGDLDALGTRTINIFRDAFNSGNTLEWSSDTP